MQVSAEWLRALQSATPCPVHKSSDTLRPPPCLMDFADGRASVAWFCALPNTTPWPVNYSSDDLLASNVLNGFRQQSKQTPVEWFPALPSMTPRLVHNSSDDLGPPLCGTVPCSTKYDALVGT